MGFDLNFKDPFIFGLPLGPEYELYNQFKKGNGYTPSGPTNRPPTTAADIKLADPLKAPLGSINTKGQGSLQSALGRIQTNATASNKASGRPTGQYQGQVTGQANTAASQGIENSLAGVLGNASLKDAKNEQEYQENLKLAKEIGAINAPSLIQEIFSSIGKGANTAGEFKGLYDALGNKNKGYSSSSGENNYGLAKNPYGRNPFADYDYPTYDYDANWR